MIIKTLNFNTLTVANPYVIGSDPDNLTGYALSGTGTMRITSLGGVNAFRNATGNCFFYDSNALDSDTIEVETVIGTNTSYAGCGFIIPATGNGYYLQSTGVGSTIKLFRVNAWAISTQVVSLSYAFVEGATRMLRYTKSTGDFEIFADGVKQGSTVNNTAHVPTHGCVISEGGNIRTITTRYSPALEITDFNGGDDIYSGQGSVTFDINSTLNIVSVTTNQTGVTVSGIVNNGDGTGTVNISDFADGVGYPALPATVLFTFTDSDGNIGTITKTLALDPDWSQVSYASAIPLDDRVLCGHFQEAVLSIADGSRAIWETLTGFECLPNGDTSSDALRTVLIKYRPVDTGIMSFWNVTIDAAGGIVDAEITSVGTVRIGGTTAVTVTNFTDAVNAGTIDGVALTSASNTSITVGALTDGENVPRPGTRELELTDGTETATTEVPVNPPDGWSSYTITGDFVEAINGVFADYLPVGWATADFILSPNSPVSGKTTTVSDSGVVTNNVGNQELFLVDAATGLATAFDIETTAGAGSIGTGSATEPTMQVIRMETLSMVGL